MFPEICWKAVQNVLELTPRCLNKLFLYCNSFAFWPTTHIVFFNLDPFFAISVWFLTYTATRLHHPPHLHIHVDNCDPQVLPIHQGFYPFCPIYIYNPFVWQILDQFELGLQFTRTAGKLKFWRNILLKQCRCTCRQWYCYVVVVIVAYMVISIILGLWAQMLHVCKKKLYMDGYFYPIFLQS